MVDFKKILHNEDHDPIESNYVSGQDAYGRHRAKDGILSYIFLPFVVAFIASVGANELWFVYYKHGGQTLNHLIAFQLVATFVALAFGARGLGRRLLSGFLVWCIFSVHIIVLAAQGRINLSALFSGDVDPNLWERLLSLLHLS